MKRLIIILYALLSILSLSQSLQCDEENIEHCVKCGLGDDADTCTECEPGYFLFFHNLLCLKCDHEIYGDVGCGGNCSSLYMNETRNIVCDANSCKENYFNLKGMCYPCSIESPDCGTCLVATKNNEFTCTKCINNQFKIESYDKKCHHCYKDHCVRCHYDSNENVVCDQCRYEHFVNSQGNCILCYHNVPIPGGFCTVCSENLKDFSKGPCYCYHSFGKSGQSSCQYCGKNCAHCNINKISRKSECYMCDHRYALNPGNLTCEACSANCGYCIFNSKTQKTECRVCDHRYALNPKTHECVFCDKNCANCHLDEEGEPICDLCLPGFELNEDNNCLVCPDNCISCKENKKKNNLLECTRCVQKYGVNEVKNCSLCADPCFVCYFSDSYSDWRCKACRRPFIESKEDQCIKCQSIAEIGGEGCYNDQCRYNRRDDRYECYLCLGHQIVCDRRDYSYDSYDEICHMADAASKYVHVSNLFKCLPNENNSGESINLNNCFKASYNLRLNKYECHICKGHQLTCEYYNYYSYNRWWRGWRRSLRKCYVTDPNSIYCHVKNVGECLINTSTEPALIRVNGCYTAMYNHFRKRYECTSCKPGYIMVYNDRVCKTPISMGLTDLCYGAVNLATEENPKYSCTSCGHCYVKNHEDIVNCRRQEGNLIRCHFAVEDENEHRQCQKCDSDYQMIHSDTYNQLICDDKCDNESFMKWGWCYKCNDRYHGNRGCNITLGCDYSYANDQLNCHACSKGYFSYTYGQCYSCSNEIKASTACHYNETMNKLIADECREGYMVSEDKKKCELITCDEYPEITPGCIICSDKIKNYKPKNKCQTCKDGFFKTRDESCVYCRARINGGPSCDECSYLNDTSDEIKCIDCPSGNLLSSNGKCLNCKDELGQDCESCEFVTNSSDSNDTYTNDTYSNDTYTNDTEGNEILRCSKCKENYYLNENGHCISHKSYYKYIPHCSYHVYEVQYNEYNDTNDTLDNSTYSSSNDSVSEDDENTGSGSINNTTDYVEEGNSTNSSTVGFKIITSCSLCKEGYYKNSSGDCIGLSLDTCSFISLIDDGTSQLFNECKNFCDGKSYASINYSLDNFLSGYDINLSVYTMEYAVQNFGNFSDLIEQLDPSIKTLIYQGYLCLSNSGKGTDIAPKALKKCLVTNYNEQNDTYTCVECANGWSVNEENGTCSQNVKVSVNLRPGMGNCYSQNIGTNKNPILSCWRCFYHDSLLITSESGAKICSDPDDQELEGCTEAYVNTSYLKNVYNCTKCRFGYISYYNRFLQRQTCQSIYGELIKKKELSEDAFEDVEYVNASETGECDYKYFTPDKIRCFQCKNRDVGMVGCNKGCTFSLKRNDMIQCEDGGCKSGYLEQSRGICKPCDIVNEGCIECYYSNEYLEGYYGFKRQRRFVCQKCDEGYLLSPDGTCHHCREIGFTNCLKCKYDDDEDLVCSECETGYFVGNDGNCTRCISPQVKSNNNICVNCDDVDEGGIEGCKYCANDGQKIACTICDDGYMLFEQNKTCLKISEYSEFENFINCKEVALDENQRFYCSRCHPDYVLLNEGGEIKCTRKTFLLLHDNKAGYYENTCQNAINLGTQDKPKYTCTECITPEPYDHTKNINFTKIAFVENNTAYCEYSEKYTELLNCTEATSKTENGRHILNCTKCIANNTLKFSKDTKTNLCKYHDTSKNCLVKFCRTCERDDNYFCSVCTASDYEVNKISGACVKKTEKVPAVTWKDIFRLQMNAQKSLLNGRRIQGPMMRMRGITNSQINTGHAFLVYMTFKIMVTRNNRLLEESEKVPTICEVIDSVDESADDFNIVEYDCIANYTGERNLSEMDLGKIEEDENNTLLGKTNLNDVIEETDVSTLKDKKKPTYTVATYASTATFEINEIKNITSNNYHFNVLIPGKLNKKSEPEKINTTMKFFEIDDNASCTFEIKEDNISANLACEVDLKEYKNINSFSFKTFEIKNASKPIYLSKINEVLLVNDFKPEDTEYKDFMKKLTIILIIVGVVLVVVIIISIVVYFLLKRHQERIKQKRKILEQNPIKVVDGLEKTSKFGPNKQIPSSERKL